MRELVVVTKAEPIGMLWMTPAGRSGHLLRMARQAQKDLPEGHLVARMNKFTLLDDAVRGIGGAAVGHRIGGADRWRRLVGLCDPGGKRRLLFGAREGTAEAKQESRDRCLSRAYESGQVGQKWVSRHLVATCH